MAGSCIESRMITLSFKDKKVGTVLDELIKELNTEYWISGQTINIGRREYSSNGLVLAQGEGMGFTELEVSAVDDTPPVTVFIHTVQTRISVPIMVLIIFFCLMAGSLSKRM